MKFCTQCGHELGASRTCGRCGVVAAVEPPPAPTPPPAPPRYPLFADEVDQQSPTTTAIRQLPAVPVRPGRSPRPGRRLTGRDAAAVWVAAGLCAVLLLGLGGWLLLGTGDDDGVPAAASQSPQRATASRELAGGASATAPSSTKPSTDTAGRTTTYEASNMLDGDPTTAWRMAGDGTGTALTFTFEEPVVLTEVGLVNGYAKTGREGEREIDWYAANRRVLAVEWSFDDGTTVTQQLDETTDLQTVAVPEVTTTEVRLRLVEVSAPGDADPRDTTPVSEVSLLGALA